MLLHKRIVSKTIETHFDMPRWLLLAVQGEKVAAIKALVEETRTLRNADKRVPDSNYHMGLLNAKLVVESIINNMHEMETDNA